MMRAALDRVGDRAKTPATPQVAGPQAKQRSGATTIRMRLRRSPSLPDLAAQVATLTLAGPHN